MTFSIWVASNIGVSKYFCSEHGGATEDTNQFDARNKKGDCFLSWNFLKSKMSIKFHLNFILKKLKLTCLTKEKTCINFI